METMPHKVIMNSGRVYILEKYENKKYQNGWIYFEDERGNSIVGLRKDNVEAEVWLGQEEYWEIERVNHN